MNLVFDMERIKRIGLRIAFYRKQRGLTQKALAEKANLSTSYLSKIESSGTDMTFSLLSLSSSGRIGIRTTSALDAD